MTQNERVLNYIADFGSITTLDAFADLGVTRLASRIHELTRRGYSFERETVTAKNRFGESVHYTRYRMA